MRGGRLHNEIIIDPLDHAFREIGASVRREMFVRIGADTAYADLVAELGGWRFVVEAELSARRVANDLLKGMALDADELWIVVPDRRIAGCVERRLAALAVRRNQGGLFVLTLGQALQRVRNYLPLIAGS